MGDTPLDDDGCDRTRGVKEEHHSPTHHYPASVYADDVYTSATHLNAEHPYNGYARHTLTRQYQRITNDTGIPIIDYGKGKSYIRITCICMCIVVVE